MSAQKALSYLREQGVSVRLDGGDVLLVGAEHLPEKAIARLREIKPKLVAELQNETAEWWNAPVEGWPHSLTIKNIATDKETIIDLRRAPVSGRDDHAG